MMTNGLSFYLLLATTSRDQAGGALCSATVPRPTASSLMSLRRAHHRPDPWRVAGIQPLHTERARCLGATYPKCRGVHNPIDTVNFKTHSKQKENHGH